METSGRTIQGGNVNEMLMNVTDNVLGLKGRIPKVPFITIVTPAYNEAKSLPVLYQRLRDILEGVDANWEWIIVDDHSSDETPLIIKTLTQEENRVRGFRFSRNFGSHIAITCGLNHAGGDCAIVMAADFQDPPEEIPRLITEWQQGAQVVWAVRDGRKGERLSHLGFARLYYSLMRKMDALKDLPPTGADFFLIDRHVIDAFNQFHESNMSIFALINWMGFRQTSINYRKQARIHGRSGWNLKKKLKLVIDSFTSFTYMPLRLMIYIGFIVALLGFSYAVFVFTNALSGTPIQGWASLMVVILVIGGIQMLMMGLLGEYLWRALDESRRRPRYLIESTIYQQSDSVPSHSGD
jgi:glycosyltransferase involved in cell wall biosynthesis